MKNLNACFVGAHSLCLALLNLNMWAILGFIDTFGFPGLKRNSEGKKEPFCVQIAVADKKQQCWCSLCLP